MTREDKSDILSLAERLPPLGVSNVRISLVHGIKVLNTVPFFGGFFIKVFSALQ